jgi:hypothetical protein
MLEREAAQLLAFRAVVLAPLCAGEAGTRKIDAEKLARIVWVMTKQDEQLEIIYRR